MAVVAGGITLPAPAPWMTPTRPKYHIGLSTSMSRNAASASVSRARPKVLTARIPNWLTRRDDSGAKTICPAANGRNHRPASNGE
jgi:hypothetical protein